MAITERFVSSSGSATYAASTSSATPCSLATAFTTGVAGDRFNIKNDGAYTFSSNTLSGGGTATDPLIFRGYNTTPGDGYLGRTNGNGPLVTTNMPTITWTRANHEWSDHLIVESLNISGNANLAGPINSNAGDGYIMWQFTTTVNYIHCKINNTGGGGCVNLNGSNSSIINCDLSTGGSDGDAALAVAGSSQRVIGCRVTGGSAPGVASAAGIQFIANTIYRSTIGLQMTGGTTGQLTLYGNTFANNTSDGVQTVGTATGISTVAIGNMFTDNGGYGINLNAASIHIALLAFNRYRNNTSGAKSSADWGNNAVWGEITSGSASDYVNAASDDYRLITSSPAVQAGLIQYASIGANQIQWPSFGVVF